MSSSAQFNLSYYGEALESGLMDVRELAPALLAMGDLLQESNRVLYGEQSNVNVQVRADFSRSSFHVDLQLFQATLAHAKDFILGNPVGTAKELLERVFFFGGLPITAITSLYKFIKWVRGREIKQSKVMTFSNESGVMQITMVDGDVTIVHPDVWKLYNDDAIRRAAGRVVKPVTREGVDRAEIKSNENPDFVEVVTKDEVGFFLSQEFRGEVVLDTTHEAFIEVVRLSFDGSHKWSFSDGGSRFPARLADPSFLSDIDNGEPFSKGDQFRVKLHTRTWRGEDGKLHTEYEILEVLEHIHKRRDSQLDIPH